jgi:hypothetical protein
MSISKRIPDAARMGGRRVSFTSMADETNVSVCVSLRHCQNRFFNSSPVTTQVFKVFLSSSAFIVVLRGGMAGFK